MAARAALLLLLAAALATEARHLSQDAPKAAPPKPVPGAAKPAPGAAKPAPAAAKPVPPKPVPAGALAPTSLYVQSAQRATVERLQNGEYKLVLQEVNPVTLWFTDRPVREAGVVPHTTFLGFLGATRANPVNAAIVTAFGKDKQQIVPVLLHDGKYQDGAIVWYGKPLLSLATIKSPGAVIAEHLKPGQRMELRTPSLFLDGAAPSAMPPTAVTLWGGLQRTAQDSIGNIAATVQAGMERDDSAAAMTSAAMNQPALRHIDMPAAPSTLNAQIGVDLKVDGAAAGPAAPSASNSGSITKAMASVQGAAGSWAQTAPAPP